ncbi:hypothetical protein PLEOSDRAFT_162947 [Pleurotus ostreatus PC15]|uniref:Uncharacterized protein n=1 Tax=Pleurotus ostreatus (strain PC15) TaxID=1137138 RepID=A0A067N7S3_PLEO1|nr:hypothetical protein PLEOSDRAFT_162947 [Pleurotus ostreatus PC15]
MDASLARATKKLDIVLHIESDAPPLARKSKRRAQDDYDPIDSENVPERESRAQGGVYASHGRSIPDHRGIQSDVSPIPLGTPSTFMFPLHLHSRSLFNVLTSQRLNGLNINLNPRAL